MSDDRKFQIMFDNLSEYQLELIQKMKYHASQLGNCIEQLTPKRETAIAFTNLEQGMMWAIKAVCLETDVTDCAHHHDGFFYLRKEGHTIQSETLDGEINFDNAEYKCKKCGAFYK